ncbi:MAG TPA: hypothetical protein VHX86_03415 [Tepidisphaeraceae bacterium]|jgi:hypothetical protein|nr:hypothetical protein [Tepidisphaeraceae bacterium]
MKFEWDDAKAAANRRKHGVSFEEVCSRRFGGIAMSKKSHKHVKFTPEELAYEPDDIDVTKLRHVGKGAEVVKKLAERSKRTVGLDADVSRVFRDSESVNNALRAIIRLVLPREKKRRKSA